MRNSLLISCIVTILSLCGCAHFHSDPPLANALFSALAPAESINVDYRSSGCFHHARYEFTFRPTDNGLEVSGVDRSFYWDYTLKKEKKDVDRTLCSVTITKSDAVRLDRLLEFYRSGPSGGCTTDDEIVVTKHSGRSVRTIEKFEDGSCATYSRKDLLTFGMIAQKMKPKK